MELGFSEPRFSHLRDGCWQPDEEASRLRLHHLEKPKAPSVPHSLSLPPFLPLRTLLCEDTKHSESGACDRGRGWPGTLWHLRPLRQT